MPDRTSELADDYAEMQKLDRRTSNEAFESDWYLIQHKIGMRTVEQFKGEIVDGTWFLVERKNGRRWIEEIQFMGEEEYLNFHADRGDTVTPITAYRKS